MFLTDGELVIQALLRRELHYFVSTAGEILPGAIVGLENFELKTGSRRNPASGRSRTGSNEIVYLAVGRFRRLDCSNLSENVGQSADQASAIEYADPVVKRVQTLENGEEENGDEKGRFSDKMNKDVAQEETVEEEEPRQKKRRLTLDMPTYSENGSDKTNGTATTSKVQTPQQPSPEVETTHTTKPSEICEQTKVPPHPSSLNSSTIKTPTGPTQQSTPSLSQTHHIYSHPTPQSRALNLRTLAYLLHPPTPRQKRNYICDIIGVISWISPHIVKRPSMPPKRDLRIIDPTILPDLKQRRSSSASSSGGRKGANFELGMALSVFVDAAGFNPARGTVALFRTLRTHEWEGTSLNAYEIDCKGKEWFVTDSRKLMAFGADVDGLRRWWVEVRDECAVVNGQVGR